MQECWETDPKDRPTFKRVAGLIRADLEDLTHDEAILNRTNHMQQRSIRSRHGLLGPFDRKVSANAQHNAGMEPSLSANDDCTMSAGPTVDER